MRNPFKRTRNYGGDRTIHHTGYLDVETHHGTVVAVWFRCQPLPFQQSEASGPRATDMESMYREDCSFPNYGPAIPKVVSIELEES